MTEPAAPRSTNGIAVAGFVLALCAVALFWLPVVAQIVWILGLIFSAIGLAKARKTARRPRHGLAVAGLVVSLAGVVVFILALADLVAIGAAGA